MINGIYTVVTPFFPAPDNWRGAYCLDFVKSLERVQNHWQVLVFKPGDGADYEIEGIRVFTFKTRQLPSNLLPFLFARHNQHSFLKKLSQVLSSLSTQTTQTTQTIQNANSLIQCCGFPVRSGGAVARAPTIGVISRIVPTQSKNRRIEESKNPHPSTFQPFNLSTPNSQPFNLSTFQPFNLSTVSVCHAHTRDCVIYAYALKKLNPNCLTLMHHHDLGSVDLRNGHFHRLWLQRLSILLPVRKYYESIDCHVFISKMVERSFRAFPDTSWTPYEDYRHCGHGFRWYRPFKIKHALILHNGVDTSIFKPVESGKLNVESITQTTQTIQPPLCVEARGSDQLPTTNQPTTTFTIGCVANLDDCKDPITLVKACILVQRHLQPSTFQPFNLSTPTPRLPQSKNRRIEESKNPHPSTFQPFNLSTLKLIVVGSGGDVPEMQRLASESGLELEIRTEVTHSQLPAFYHSLDLFVLPSYFEGFGCVFTEAYACGVPFITCEGQGMEDYIAPEDRHLWLCQIQNPDDLAAKILYNIRNRPTQRLTGEIAIDPLVREFVEKVEKLKC